MDHIADASLELLGLYGRDLLLCIGIIGGFAMAGLVAGSVMFDDDTPPELTEPETRHRLEEASRRYQIRKQQARIAMFGRGRKYEGEEIADPEPPVLD